MASRIRWASHHAAATSDDRSGFWVVAERPGKHTAAKTMRSSAGYEAGPAATTVVGQNDARWESPAQRSTKGYEVRPPNVLSAGLRLWSLAGAP